MTVTENTYILVLSPPPPHLPKSFLRACLLHVKLRCGCFVLRSIVVEDAQYSRDTMLRPLNYFVSPNQASSVDVAVNKMH